MNIHHIPVLIDKCLEYLVTVKDGIYFDGTLGFGGHSSGILNTIGPGGTLVSTDVDQDAFSFSKKKFSDEKRIKLYNLNFSQIDIIAKIESIQYFNGIFADLGVSSFQLDTVESGFSYRNNAPLDLRMDKSKVINAADVVNSYSEEDLANIIFQNGEEKNSRKIAKVICEVRREKQIQTTLELSNIITELTPQRFHTKTLSRVFQALRIYVNDELNTLKSFLKKSVDLLIPGGRLVILSYHSLEDRIVKELFKYETLDCICPPGSPICTCNKVPRLKIITKKPISPDEIEINNNFRSRSAKLRAAERI
ncbi:MAG: 16S rRNA (cytosine(1402)-N(4))-methyltransferase RsmH [Ignavibacteriaceae bacterium]|nr:16S rRNA (cytosine(1402)-N(4))-methyltransferase RsmH [Ignavibacteriaceae bacterium]